MSVTPTHGNDGRSEAAPMSSPNEARRARFYSSGVALHRLGSAGWSAQLPFFNSAAGDEEWPLCGVVHPPALYQTATGAATGAVDAARKLGISFTDLVGTTPAVWLHPESWAEGVADSGVPADAETQLADAARALGFVCAPRPAVGDER